MNKILFKLNKMNNNNENKQINLWICDQLLSMFHYCFDLLEQDKADSAYNDISNVMS